MGRPARNTARGSEVLRRKRLKRQQLLLMFDEKFKSPKTSIKALAEKYNIPYTSAQRRWRAYEQAHKVWDDAGMALALGDRRGGHNRAFTSDAESRLKSHLQDTFPIVTHGTINRGALVFRHQQQIEQGVFHRLRSSPRKFEASQAFITGFKRRNRLTLRGTDLTTHKFNLMEKDISKDKVCMEYIDKVKSAIAKYGKDLVLNMDEVPEQLVEQPAKAVVNTGSQTLVKIPTAATCKSYLTLFPTITASGKKLTLCTIIRGKTDLVVRNVKKEGFAAVEKVKFYHALKGKMNTGIMLFYLKDIIIPYTKGRPCALLLDDYKSHWTEHVTELAAQNSIELIHVPKSRTAVLQPLDVHFNGPWKAKRKHIWLEKKQENPFIPDSRGAAIDRAQIAYESINKQTILRAWRDSHLC